MIRESDTPQAQPDASSRRSRLLAALTAVPAAMHRAAGEGEAVAQALGCVLEALPGESGRISLWDPQTERLALAAAQGDIGGARF